MVELGLSKSLTVESIIQKFIVIPRCYKVKIYRFPQTVRIRGFPISNL